MKKTNPLSVNKIENMANKVREKFNISGDSCFPILNILENLHYNGILTIQYLVDNDELFDEMTPAKYSPMDNFIYIKESVLDELEDGEYRANFTLAHELFHFIQHKILNFNFEDSDICHSYEDAEWQANEFAGQLLVPTKLIIGNIDEKKLSKILMVSEHCILTRKLYYRKRNKLSNDK